MRWSRRKAVQISTAILPATTIDVLRTLDNRVRPDFRRTVVFGLLALAALVAGLDLGGIHARTLQVRLGAWGCALVVVVFGVLSSRAAASEVDRVVSNRASVSAASTLRLLTLLIGYFIALVAVLSLLRVSVQLLAGGTVVAVVLGIAAQQVLGNLFAGLVLLFARPYVPGQRIRVHSGALGGPHDGVVTSVGLLYTTLLGADGDINIPNASLLAAAVGGVEKEADVQASDPTGTTDPVDG